MIYTEYKILYILYSNKKYKEFDDGSNWTLSKYLTHANRTTNYLLNIYIFNNK